MARAIRLISLGAASASNSRPPVSPVSAERRGSQARPQATGLPPRFAWKATATEGRGESGGEAAEQVGGDEGNVGEADERAGPSERGGGYRGVWAVTHT